jgi:hypothetical protein
MYYYSRDDFLWGRPPGLRRTPSSGILWLRLRCSVGQDGILRGGC